MSTKKRVLIIDQLNQFIRAWYVNPTISPEGDPIGGVVGSLKILQKTLRIVRPDEIIVTWDGEGGSAVRKKHQKTYKEGRKPITKANFGDIPGMSDEDKVKNRFDQQVRLAEYYNNMPVRQIRIDGVEADDIISYVCQSQMYKDWQKVVFSNDNDFVQLLGSDGDVVLYRPGVKIVEDQDGNKKREDEVLNYHRALEKYGISPHNWALAKAIVGDTSDNVIGVPRVGFKSLAKKVPTFSDSEPLVLNDVFEHINNQKKKLKMFESILNNEDLIRNNLKVVQLSSPLINYSQRKKIDKIMDTSYDKINLEEIRMMMVKDGIYEVDFTEMLGYMEEKIQ